MLILDVGFILLDPNFRGAGWIPTDHVFTFGFPYSFLIGLGVSWPIVQAVLLHKPRSEILLSIICPLPRGPLALLGSQRYKSSTVTPEFSYVSSSNPGSSHANSSSSNPGANAGTITISSFTAVFDIFFLWSTLCFLPHYFWVWDYNIVLDPQFAKLSTRDAAEDIESKASEIASSFTSEQLTEFRSL